MQYNLEIESARTGSYAFEEPLLKLFTIGYCEVTISEDKLLFTFENQYDKSVTITFPILGKSTDAFHTTSYLLSTDLNYPIKFSTNELVKKFYKFSSQKRDGFETVYIPQTNGYSYMANLNRLYPIKTKTFEFVAHTKNYTFDSSDIIKLIDEINSILETDQMQVGETLYRTKMAYLSETEFSELRKAIEQNLDHTIELYKEGAGDLEAIDFIETCITKDSEPDYFFLHGQIHSYHERYCAACRSLTSAIAIGCDMLPHAYFFLAISMNNILANTNNITDPKHNVVIKEFVIKHLNKAKSMGFAEASNALSQIFGM